MVNNDVNISAFWLKFQASPCNIANDRKVAEPWFDSRTGNALLCPGAPRGGAGGYNDPGGHGLQEGRRLQRAHQRAMSSRDTEKSKGP